MLRTGEMALNKTNSVSALMTSIKHAISRYYNFRYRGVTGFCYGTTKKGSHPRMNFLLHDIFEDDIDQLKFESNALDSGIQNRRPSSLNERNNQWKNIGKNSAVPNTHAEPGIVPVPTG